VHLQQVRRQGVREFCVEDSGGDGVDGDVEVRGLARKAFGKTDHRGLRGGVVDGSGERADRADGGDVENRALALADHLLVDRLRHGEEAADVRSDHFVPGAVGRRREIVAPVDRRVVDENINAAPLLYELARQSFHAQTIRNRDLEAVRASAMRLDFLRHRLGEVFARVIVESHVRAFAREDFTHRRADAARASRNKRPFTFQQKTQLGRSPKKPASFLLGAGEMY
jgi:hypothetical protein